MEKILAQLDSMHRKLLATITPIGQEDFARRPSEAEWSVAEVVHHLYLVERRVLKELEDGLARPPQRPGLRQRLIPLRLLVGSRVVRVKAPKGVQPLSPPSKEAVIENYNRVRADLKEFCAQHGRARLEQVIFKHPFLGDFDGVRAVSFAGYHELRHYKQIQEIVKKICESKR